jgi:NADH dehydrogenase
MGGGAAAGLENAALGSTMDRDSVPGVSDYAYTLTPSGERSAQTLRTVLPELNAAGGRVLIGGGGATGIESAAEFADTFPNLRIHLVTAGKFGDFRNQRVADYMEKSLRRRDIAVQDETTITELRAHEAVTDTGTTIPFDLCLWTGGFKALPLAREAGLAVNERGQILVDPYLRSISHPDIFAVGDAAQPVEEPGVPVRMSSFVAIVMGLHAADNLSRAVRGKAQQPLSFAYYGQAIALGHHDAILFNIFPADKPAWPYLTGRLGFWVREFFVAYNRWIPRYERWPGLLYIMGKGGYAAAKRRAEKQLSQARQSG